MPNYPGTVTGLASTPGLLISTLNSVQDPKVVVALREIQQWANTVGSVLATPGTGNAAFSTGNCPATIPGGVALWTKVSYKGTPGYIPVWI